MRRIVGNVALCLVVFAAAGVAPQSDATATVRPDGKDAARDPAAARAAELLGRLPASFDANDGQFDERVRLAARAGGVAAWFVDGETVLRLGGDDPGLPESPGRPRRATRCDGVLRMKFPSSSSPRGEARLPSNSNWFLGSDPSGWRTGVASFGRARYEDAAPGVDVVWRGTRRALAYDVVVTPGADPSAFSIEFEGARSLTVDPESGDLVVTTPTGAELRHSRPRCYQSIGGAQRDVAGRFVVDGARVSFAVDAWDRSRELVIDPTLDYSTFLGGNGEDWGFQIAAAPSGDLFVAGRTTSTNFPLVAALQASNAGSADVFVARVKADGSALLASTYLGGSANDACISCCLSPAGDVFLSGYTNSTNFPTVSAAQPGYAGGFNDAFVTRLPPSLNQLTYSTYLGGNGDDSSDCVVADASGAAYVVGRTVSNNFPLVNPRQATPGGGASDAFVTKLAPSGTGYVYSTFHGGNYDDWAYCCALDPTGSLAVAGTTLSTNFPTTNAFQPSHAGGLSDGYVSKFSAAGNGLVFSTYVGGSGGDLFFGVAVDAAGTVSACGQTQSTNYPMASAAQGSFGGGSHDAVVTKIQSFGTALAFSTYLGGSGMDAAYGMTLDSLGGIVVTGTTGSTNFPLLKALQAGYGGGTSDAFVARYAPGTSALVYSTYFGGSLEESGYRPVVDSNGNVCFSGRTLSTNFPRKNAYQVSYGGGTGDAYVVRLAPSLPPAPASLAASLVGTSSAHLTWNDQSSDETEFEIQRRLNSGPYTTYASVPAGTVSYDDTSMFASQTYTYRVRAIGIEGPSAFTNEASVLTPAGATAPPPPKSPDGLRALAVSPTEVAVSWRDRSNDETYFEVQRAVGSAAYVSLGTVPQDSVYLSDTLVPPGWPTSYRVRALSVQGPSEFTIPAIAATQSTIALTTSSGLAADSRKPGRDKLKWKGTFAFAAAPTEPVDPRQLAVRVQAGPPGAPILITIPADDPAWKVKRTKYKWKSAKGVSPRVAVTLDTGRMTFSVTASAFDFAVAPDAAEQLLLAVGTDGGRTNETWLAQRAAGSFAPPKP